MKRLAKIKCDRSKSAAVNARAELPRAAKSYFAVGRQVVGGKPSYTRLHRLRLETKRFRYTLEVFASVYGPSMERRIESLKQVQDQLGDINDCASIRELLVSEAPKKKPPALKTLLDRLDRDAERRIQEFTSFWTNVFDAPGQRDQWIGYLGRFAGKKKSN